MADPPLDPKRQGIEGEPHLRPRYPGTGGFAPDPREVRAERALTRSGPDGPAAAADQDVFDEPAFRATRGTPIVSDFSCPACEFNLRGLQVGMDCPECGQLIHLGPPGNYPHASGPGGTGYAAWLGQRMAESSAARSWAVVLGIVLLGGPWAVIGALLSTWGGLMAIVVVAPAVEEVMKIGLIALLIETRPYLLRSRTQIFLAAAGSGLMFAVIENLIYLNLYIPDPGPGIIAWRWIVCTALHVGCSSVAAVGAVRVWHKVVHERRKPDGPIDLRWLVLAIVLHGTYNAAVTVAEMSGFAF